ncbi:unnamed protein product [Allacma fusca]|uniref:Uncharacterized protein n=1 Tax=Allacma fusca TaxID=39272 RepID=A0A8J2PTJ4_9HEXA|nr:unnamed protein product [Allacma fusca]
MNVTSHEFERKKTAQPVTKISEVPEHIGAGTFVIIIVWDNSGEDGVSEATISLEYRFIILCSGSGSGSGLWERDDGDEA